MEWLEHDGLRPLDERGFAQARLLPVVLDGYPVARIVSSPLVRCVQTVEPLAAAHGLQIEERTEISEGAAESDWRPLFSELAGTDTVACVHGDLTLTLFGRKVKKGAVWVVDESLQPLRVLHAP